MSSDSYPLFGETLLGLCEGTVVSVWRQIWLRINAGVTPCSLAP